MTFIAPFILASSLARTPAPDCTLTVGSRTAQRAFTNADLDRMAACRHQTGVESEPRSAVAGPEKPPQSARRGSGTPLSETARRDAAEADWRARWQSVDQKVLKLRREAHELRLEAAESPRDPKKRVVGRRSPSLLIARAQALENEARNLADEFDERARREGALPGWIRPSGR